MEMLKLELELTIQQNGNVAIAGITTIGGDVTISNYNTPSLNLVDTIMIVIGNSK